MHPARFGLIGLGGYIAPRHLKAIKECGGELVCAMDRSDSVGIVDSYFPDTHFFTEFERFDRHIHKLRYNKTPLHYVSICSPNYLHDAHIRLALRNEADAICEKPLVLNPWNLDFLSELQKEYGKKIYTILQLRLHPKIIELKNSIDKNKTYDIELTYITRRGRWYDVSWKGDISKSGGVGTNIGIHFFDMLLWIFGGVRSSRVDVSNHRSMAGILELERANVKWFLSIDSKFLPDSNSTHRSLRIDNKDIEFSDGFMDLHTKSYENIMSGNGFGCDDVRGSVELTYNIRNATPTGIDSQSHHLATKFKNEL